MRRCSSKKIKYISQKRFIYSLSMPIMEGSSLVANVKAEQEAPQYVSAEANGWKFQIHKPKKRFNYSLSMPIKEGSSLVANVKAE